MRQLRQAATIGIDDLKVAEPVRPSAHQAPLALACRRASRWLRGAPWLRVERERLIVVHPALLAEPIELARDAVAVAAVDTRSRDAGETLRFPYAHELACDAGETYGWLYRRGARSPLALLCDAAAPPNVAILFAEPQPLPGRRGVGRAVVPGLLTRACDGAAARSALRDWGADRPLTAADARRASI